MQLGLRVRAAAVAVAIAVSPALGGCSGGAAETLATAQLEEKQNELEHARKLYRDVVERYPGTDQARQAEERLQALGAAQ